MTIGELLTRMSSREIQEWKVIYQIEHSERELAKQHAQAGFS